MDSSRLGVEKSMAAANMETLMVLPNLLKNKVLVALKLFKSRSVH